MMKQDGKRIQTVKYEDVSSISEVLHPQYFRRIQKIASNNR